MHTSGAPEAWLIDSKAKVPKSRQWNLGIRHLFGNVLVTGTYAGVRGVDQLTLNWANFGLNPNGSCCTSFNLAAHGFSNFIYSTNDGKTWYDAFTLQVDRQYHRSSPNFGWGAGFALTYATRSVQGVDNLGDEFSFPNTQKHPQTPDQRREVAHCGELDHGRAVSLWDSVQRLAHARGPGPSRRWLSREVLWSWNGKESVSARGIHRAGQVPISESRPPVPEGFPQLRGDVTRGDS